ncbi:MAG: homocysteine S-methyltransferase family protein, partial [Lachnospiraceae bacterium]|nr:homocysteine S-methyltransferase family protein [Lachnospiraceae bacterium]
MGRIDLNNLDRYLIFDGGMGTMLQNAGLAAGEIPERWNIERPEDVKKVHRAYVEAGADVVSANTFGANSHKLPADLDVESCIAAAVRLARESGARFVAQDIGPVGALLAPLGTLTFEEAYELFKEQVLAGEKAGTDIYIIETMTDIYEMKAALLAVKENCDKPVIASMSYQEDGRTFLGTPPEVATYTMCCLGADAVGVNCSLGPKELYPIVEKICSVSTKPVIVQANAGLPRLVDGETVYDIGPKEYADHVEK